MTHPSRSRRPVDVYWTELNDDGWRIAVAATDDGLAFVGSQGKGAAELEAWAAARFGENGYALAKDESATAPYREQLAGYLQGKRAAFDLPLDLAGGTAFQRNVWQAMNEIGYGSTATYSDIAARVGKPNAVRAVGAAIGRNPALIVLPCHRIVGKSGALTGYRGGLDMKERLLRLEGGG